MNSTRNACEIDEFCFVSEKFWKIFLSGKKKKKKRDVKMCSLSSSIYTLNRHKSIICFDFLLRLQSSSTV